MGLFDEIRKIAQPYDEDDDSDFFEGADTSFKPKPKPQEEKQSFASAAQAAFENSFGNADRSVEVQPQSAQPAARPQSENTSIFGNFGFKKSPKQPKIPGRERTVNFGGKDTSVMLFNPKTFDEAGELVNYLLQNLTVVMTLEGVQADMARRLLDFVSGITFALQGKITPVSGKTYFVTPQNVDILGAAPEQPETSGHYL